MAKPNWSRALFSLGDNLGALANSERDREHERVMAMREENLTKLRYQLEGEQIKGNQEYMTKENDKLRADQAQQHLSDQLTAVEQANLDRAARAKEGAADRALMSERYNREDLANADAGYLRQLNAIDERIATISDMRTKAGLEGQVPDPETLKGIDTELAQLQAQKRSIGQERDLNLARRGDQRYKKLSPEEAKALLAQQAPPASAPTGQPPVAAQGPAIKTPRPAQSKGAAQVPQMPPMDPEMQQRLQRQGRQIIPPEAQQVLQSTQAPAATPRGNEGRSLAERNDVEAKRVGARRSELEKLDRLTLERLKRDPDTDRETRAMIREVLADISRRTTRAALDAQR